MKSLVELVTSQVRQYGGDTVYLNYFYPKRVQPLAVALQAITIKLNKVHHKPNAIGNLQFEWWKQEMDKVFTGQRVEEPSLMLLQQATQQFKLTKYHTSRLIKAHHSLFSHQNRLSDLQSLADWSGASQASILYLLLQATANQSATQSPITQPPSILPHSSPFQHDGTEHALEAEADGLTLAGDRELSSIDFDHAASHLAVALAIQQILEQIPVNAKHKINLIPTEIGAKFGLTDEALFRFGPQAEGLRESVANLVGIGKAELKTSRSCLNSRVPSDRLPVFLGGVMAESVFDLLSSDHVLFDVFDHKLHKRNWKLPFTLAFKNFNKQF